VPHQTFALSLHHRWMYLAPLSHLSLSFVKEKEEVTSPGGESDSNSTTTTPKTVISNQSSLPHHSPTPSLGSEASLGGSDRDRPATPKPTPWLPRSVTPVSWLHCCTWHCSVAVSSVIQDLSLRYILLSSICNTDSRIPAGRPLFWDYDIFRIKFMLAEKKK
jgi:hypothetical protein